MRVISKELIEALQHKALSARITLDGWQIIQNDPEGDEPIQTIHFEDGSSGDTGAVSIGSTIAASATVSLEKSLVDYALAEREMLIELGMTLPSGEEWFEMGTYTITDVQKDDGTITVTAMDAMVSKLDTEYEPIEGLDPESDEGVSAKAFVHAACQHVGLSADLDGLPDHTLSIFSPDGCTWRQLIGFIAGLYGRFAKIDRDGVLRFLWYQNVDVRITPDDYYENGIQRGSYAFTVSWLKCYNEVLEETLSAGDTDASQGIYFACPWMTQEILDGLWTVLRGYSYAPVPELTFFGDPRLETGDAPRLICLDGEVCRIPVMGITHDWDGGLITSISCSGQVRSDAHEGPVQRETKRSVAKILKRADSIEMSVQNAENEISYLQLQAEGIAGRVEDNEGNIAQLQLQAEELEAKAEDAAGNIAALQIQADELRQTVENASGDFTQIQQTAGQVNVKAEDENGSLETKINPEVWAAQRTDKEGKVTSSFRFDFGIGQFVFDGTGKFMAPDGKSYITVDGGAFVLYAQDAYGTFLDIARIGYSEDSEGVDYPYLLLGRDNSNNNMGLIKAFSNGVYIGNSAPKLSTGNFVGLPGASGFFVDAKNARTYSVKGETLQDTFVAVFG